MSTVFFRTLILFSLIFITLKILGKRQIGELQTSELVVAMLISNLAAVPMQAVSIPLLHGVIPILTLMACELFVSFGILKSGRFRYYVVGVPSVVIRNGEIVQKELRRLRYTLDDLFEDLRQNNIMDLADVDYGILETNGKLSIILKQAAQQITCSDLKLTPSGGGAQFLLIKDGLLNQSVLRDMGLNQDFINQKLREHHIQSIHQVFLMTVNSRGEVKLSKKDGCA